MIAEPPNVEVFDATLATQVIKSVPPGEFTIRLHGEDFLRHAKDPIANRPINPPAYPSPYVDRFEAKSERGKPLSVVILFQPKCVNDNFLLRSDTLARFFMRELRTGNSLQQQLACELTEPRPTRKASELGQSNPYLNTAMYRKSLRDKALRFAVVELIPTRNPDNPLLFALSKPAEQDFKLDDSGQFELAPDVRLSSLPSRYSFLYLANGRILVPGQQEFEFGRTWVQEEPKRVWQVEGLTNREVAVTVELESGAEGTTTKLCLKASPRNKTVGPAAQEQIDKIRTWCQSGVTIKVPVYRLVQYRAFEVREITDKFIRVFVIQPRASSVSDTEPPKPETENPN